MGRFPERNGEACLCTSTIGAYQSSSMSFQEMELDDEIDTLQLQGCVCRHSSEVFCSHLGSLCTWAGLGQSLRIDTQQMAHIQDHRANIVYALLM